MDLQQCEMLAVNPGGKGSGDDQKPQGHREVDVEMVPGTLWMQDVTRMTKVRGLWERAGNILRLRYTLGHPTSL